MSIDLKKVYAAEAKPNPRLERFKEIKSFYLSHKSEVPPHVIEEYSDILIKYQQFRRALLLIVRELF